MTDQTSTLPTVTENERRVLRALLTNYFGDGDDTAERWSNCINDADEPSGLEGKALGAVCSTLSQKGLVKQHGKGRDSVIWLTPVGVLVARG